MKKKNNQKQKCKMQKKSNQRRKEQNRKIGSDYHKVTHTILSSKKYHERSYVHNSS